MSTEIRPTPETDAADTIPYMDGDELTWWVKKDFARKLERERDSAKLLNRSLLDQLEAKDAELDANGLVLQKLQDERDAYIDKFEQAEKQLEAMRDAIKEAYDAIKAVPLEYDARFFRAGKWSEAALAKLKPLLP